MFTITSIIIISIGRATFKFTSTLKIILWLMLFSSLARFSYVSILISAISSKISFWYNIISCISYLFLSCFTFSSNVIIFIAWISVKCSSINFKLTLWLKFFASLDWILYIFSPILSIVIEFPFWKEFILRLDCFFSTSLRSFILIVHCIIWNTVKLPTNLELFRLLY